MLLVIGPEWTHAHYSLVYSQSWQYIWHNVHVCTKWYVNTNDAYVRRGKRQDSDAEWMFKETVYSQLQKQGKQKVQNQDAPKEEKSFLI